MGLVEVLFQFLRFLLAGLRSLLDVVSILKIESEEQQG